MTLVAAVLASWAVWWWLPDGDALRRLGGEPSVRPARRLPRPVAVLGAAGLVIVAAGVMAGPSGVAVSLAGTVVTGTVLAVLVRQTERRRAAAQGAEIVKAGEAMAGLLRVGRVPSAALAEAAQDAPVLRVAAAEHAAGGEAAPALRRLAERPGCAGLAQLADAWEIATRTGASLVDAVDVAVQRLAAQEEVDRVVATELAAARLSGIMMAVLPLVGLGLGYALGGNPVGFLIGQPVGWVCLNVGVGLACAGVAWIDAIAAGAEGRP